MLLLYLRIQHCKLCFHFYLMLFHELFLYVCPIRCMFLVQVSFLFTSFHLLSLQYFALIIAEGGLEEVAMEHSPSVSSNYKAIVAYLSLERNILLVSLYTDVLFEQTLI